MQTTHAYPIPLSFIRTHSSCLARRALSALSHRYDASSVLQ